MHKVLYSKSNILNWIIINGKIWNTDNSKFRVNIALKYVNLLDKYAIHIRFIQINDKLNSILGNIWNVRVLPPIMREYYRRGKLDEKYNLYFSQNSIIDFKSGAVVFDGLQ